MARSLAMGIIIRLLITAFSLWLATVLIDGIELTTDSTGQKVWTLIVVAAIFGIINAVLRPIIKVVGCGLYVLTLGLIALIVNGALFLLTSWVAGQVDCSSRWPAGS
jgi:putative membrane protein